jgi:hypothetical protein
MLSAKAIPPQQPVRRTSKKGSERFPLSFLISCLIVAVPLAGCQKPQPLPEQGTYEQQLYVERCGACHRPYNPASMTAAMWELQVEVMRSKILRAGQPPLSMEQHLTILDYLKRNAGKQ